MTTALPAPDPETPQVDLLAIGAHPDDAELVCGGTLARSVAQGRRVAILDLTGGESGSLGSRELRHDEGARAAEVLGVLARRSAGLPDAGIQNTPEARQALAGWIRAFRPRVVILPFANGRHPDHRVGSQLAYDACFLAGLKRFPALGDSEPHRPFKLLYAMAYREDVVKPSFVVDITDQMDTKLRSLACYGSQFQGKTWAGEVMPGGDRPLFDQIRVQNAHYGSLIRTAYGEPFYTLETVEVEDVVGLGVRSI